MSAAERAAAVSASRSTVDGYAHPAPSVRIVADGVAARDGSIDLATCYELCRRLHATHGRTYYLATRLLPRDRRPHVHALYGFARYADDLVDHLGLGWPDTQRREALEAWSQPLLDVLAGADRASLRDPVLCAVAHTVDVLGIDPDDVRAFLRSMAMDVSVDRYATFAELREYVEGSAAAIGSMMLPVLGCDDPRARLPARSLGVAFQLTNFLRDVAEDWDRGRLYIPMEDLDAFGVSEWDLHTRHVGPRLRRLLAFQAARAEGYYRQAERGWSLLPPASRRCVRVAHRLYHGILDAVADIDYQVFQRRAAVPRRRRLAILLGELGQG